MTAQWQHVVWVTKASSRSDGESKSKKFRTYKVPMPKLGSTGEQFLADLAMHAPAAYIRALEGMRVGIALTYQNGLWSDTGKVSATKVMEYLLTKVGDPKWAARMAQSLESAKLAARAELESGMTSNDSDVSKDTADRADKVYKASWNAVIDDLRKRFSAEPLPEAPEAPESPSDDEDADDDADA